MRHAHVVGLGVWVLLAVGCDEGGAGADASTAGDTGGRLDGGGPDAALADAGRADAGPVDGAADGAVADGAPVDAATVDAGEDGAPGDAAPGDAALDAAVADAAVVDTAVVDAAEPVPDAGPAQPTPIVTEVMARNSAGLEDEDGEASDWIELFNPGGSPYDLAGHHLTDDPEDPEKWTFPAIEIPAQGFLVVFASGKDRTDPAGRLHTGFSLAGEGEAVLFTDPQGRVLSTLEFPPQAQDIAFGPPMRPGQQVLVGSGAPARLYVGPPVAGMTEVGFDDSAWWPVVQGVGFDHRPAPRPEVPLADSVSDFAPQGGAWVQGTWAVNGAYNPAALVPMPAASWNGTELSANGAALSAAGGRPAAGVWVVRRWTPPEAGPARLVVHVDNLAAAGDGVVLRVFAGGAPLVARPVDGGAIDVRLDVDLVAGQPLDFALDPGQDARFDDCGFTVRIVRPAEGLETLGDRVRTDIADALGPATTFWLRVPYEVPAGTGPVELALTFDDGIVAWVDGREVVRDNADPGTAADRPASRVLSPLRVPLAAREGPGVVTLLVVDSVAADEVFFAEAALVAPALEMDAQARYLPQPTPGAPNFVAAVDLGPIVFDLDRHQPVTVADPVVIGARVLPTAAPITEVTLTYRVMFTPEVAIPMVEEGERYVATLPPGIAQPGQMVRWYVEATDAAGRTARFPPFADPLESEQYYGTMIEDPTIQSNLPVYHWFAESPANAMTDAGSRGALWFDGELYDNIRVDLHGQATRSFPKKSFNFDFTRDHRFRVDDALERVKDFDLLTNYADKAKMRNTLSYGMFRDAGHDHHLVFPVRLHQNGAFYAVYEHVEDPDEPWLRRLGYTEPLGAVYKVYDNLSDPGRSEKKTREDEGNADLAAFIAGVSAGGEAQRTFLFDHVDMARMANFLAMLFITAGMDCCQKNYYAHHSLQTDQWWYMPWDIDLTLGRNWTGNYFDDRMFPENPPYRGRGNRLIDALYAQPDFDEMYLRRTRTLIDELMQRNDTPYPERYLENEADRLLALIGQDGVLDNAAWGTWGIPQTQAEAVRIMKEDWMIPRRVYLQGLMQAGGPPARVLLDGRPGETTARFRVPVDDALGDGWVQPGFDDRAWAEGPLGLGYEDGGADYAPFIRTPVRPRDAHAEATTVLVRVRFRVDAPLAQRLILRMRYDDGYVAWLNGVEVARRGVPAGALSFRSTAAIHDDAAAVRFEDVDIHGFSDALLIGENVLAVRLVNTAADSSDLLLLPEIVDGEVGGDGILPPAQGADLDVVVEAVEAAPGAPQEGYVVLHNRQGTSVDLSGWRLAGGGIAHPFTPGTVIPTDGRLYVVADVLAFRQRAEGPRGGQGLFVQGNWLGALVPGGMVRLEPPMGGGR